MENCEAVDSTSSELPNEQQSEVSVPSDRRCRPVGYIDRRKSFPSISCRPVGSRWTDEPFPFMPLVASDSPPKRRSEETIAKSGEQAMQSRCRLRRPLSVPDVLFEEECEIETESSSVYPLRRQPVSTKQSLAKRHSLSFPAARLPSISE
uniref:Uncharacterized protein n=1 Tax=Trichuris muris TaxID=70415 RepID=A0A5S6R659_TRIMR